MGVVDLGDVDSDALTRVVALGGHLLGARHDRLGPPKLHDGRAGLNALDHAVDDLVLALGELVEHHLALGVAQLLEHDLLGGLRRDPAESWRRHVVTRCHRRACLALDESVRPELRRPLRA